MFLGGVDGLIYALIGFVVVDYLTGVMLAITQKKLSSAVGAKGIAKKVLIFALVGLANIVDVSILEGNGSPIRDAVIFFYIANEGISLTENMANLGLPVPKKFKKILEQLKEENE